MTLPHQRPEFPNLKKFQYKITSLPDVGHNCIAYAAGDLNRKWWPGAVGHWPEGVPEEETLDAFQRAFATLGYKPTKDGKHEKGFEKIAFYATRDGVRHAARQMLDGKWKSKLGDDYDIEHVLRDLEGTSYGKVVAFMKRPIRSTKELAVEKEKKKGEF